jgi:hypothetical protein
MRLTSRGDTIVEVLFAITVFAMVAVGSLMIMNQGTAAAQRALEITLVRQQIDAQAEVIRFIHQSYVSAYQRDGVAPGGTAAEWDVMAKDRSVARASDFGVAGGTCPAAAPARSFIVNARLARVASAPPQMSAPAGASLPPFSQIVYNDDNSIAQAYGIWVEAVPANVDDGPSFVDFHIRACWNSAGSSVPATLGTIVRLYEPR